MRYYVDKRTWELVTEEDSIDINILAPEQYYEYCKNGLDEDNSITETWFVGANKYIDYSYDSNLEKQLIIDGRYSHFKNNNCDLDKAILKRFTVPKKLFEEALKAYNLN